MNSTPTPPATANPDSTDFLKSLCESFGKHIAHSHALGISAESVAADGAQTRLPCRPEFIGDIQRGIIHTGVITSLIDSTCGLAVMAHIGQPQAIATLDLRVDYLRASHANSDLHCRAECYRTTTHIVFVRTQVWQDDPAQPVAQSLGTFMRTPSRQLFKS